MDRRGRESADEADFDELYAASARRLVGQVYAVTGSLTEAEDAVAEAFVRAWQRWATVSQVDNPEAWVRRVALRLAVSSWRKAVNRVRAHGRAASREHLPGPDMGASDLQAAPGMPIP